MKQNTDADASTELKTGDYLYNPAKHMGLGVVVYSQNGVIKTQDVSGKQVERNVSDVETMLETSSLEIQETPDWF